MSSYVEAESIRTTIASGDAYLAAKKWENAVQAYQAAGNQAAIEPNTVLQALDWHLASEATATKAQSLAKQILAAYQASVPAQPTPAPVGPAAPAPNVGAWIFGGIAVVGVGALFYLMARGPGALARNPARGSGRRRVSARKGLIAKGRAVYFEMNDGRRITAKGGMLHDPSGRAWPSRSVLVGPFTSKRLADDDEFQGDARHYLGGHHRARIGILDTPPKPLGGWFYEGVVDEIQYTRTGSSHPGGYYHPFNRGLFALFKGKRPVKLYSRGRYYRLQLPRGAILDARGFVDP